MDLHKVSVCHQAMDYFLCNAFLCKSMNLSHVIDGRWEVNILWSNWNYDSFMSTYIFNIVHSLSQKQNTK